MNTFTAPILVVHPKPTRTESMLGYCLRLGDANGFRHMKWLSAILTKCETPSTGVDNLTLLTGHSPQELSLLGGPAPAALGPISNWRLGLKVTYWNHGHRRWCPLCLQQQGIWKTEWMLALQVACPAHQVLLQEHCPGCGTLVPWHRGSMFHCPCGADLRRSHTAPATLQLLELASQVSAAFHLATGQSYMPQIHAAGTFPLLAPLHLPQLCDLLWLFGAYALHCPGTKPQKIPDHGQMNVILPFLSMAIHILNDWPHHFHQLLNEYTHPVAGQTASLRVYLRQLHQALAKLLVHPDLQFLRQEFECYVHTRWQDKLILQPELRAAHPIISATEAAKALKIPIRTLLRLIAAGALKGCQTIGAHGKTNWLVERASVELFSRQKHGVLNLAQVESLLRVTQKRIRLLTEHGLLKAVCKETGSVVNSRQWLFHHADINKFLEQLSHGSISTTPECAQLVSFWEITKRWMQGNDAFLAVTQALCAGELRVLGRSPADSGLRALLVSREAFKAWHQKYRLSRGFFTIPEAARHIGMNKNLFYHLINTGYVSTHMEPFGYANKKITVVRLDNLERFTRDYVWGRNLGRLLGLSEHAASSALLSKGIPPICGPTLDGAEGYVFRKADITSLTQSGFEEA